MELHLRDLIGREITLDDDEQTPWELGDYRDRRVAYRGVVLDAHGGPPPVLKLFNARNHKEIRLNPDNWTIRDAHTGETITPAPNAAPASTPLPPALPEGT
ncbi:hypothetical protein ACFC26_12680 [Kitasatospora purpeofusca]|uniref:hypothetical protein n=1 Tax=Kitasatospora purpeofusca TaxID=67352 RepID=UPI000B1738A2